MSRPRIYLSPPSVDHEELEEVRKALESGWVTTMGPAVDGFEKQLEAAYPTKRALTLNSGTSGLHLALKQAGVQAGDRVGVSSFTFCASANVVKYEQAIPVFFDSENTSWNLDPELLEAYLRKKPLKAFVLTHLFGMPAAMGAIREVCDRYGVFLIEDAAEGVGSTWDGQPLGGIGDAGVLSFNGNKLLTTGGGGALITHEEGYQQALKWATQSKESDHLAYHHEELGYNYRMSNLLAAVGLAQWRKLPLFLSRKQQIYQRYQEALGETGIFDFQQPTHEGAKSNRWLTTVVIRPDYRQALCPKRMIDALELENIEARFLWKPMHLQPLYADCEMVQNHVSETLFEWGLCLPSGVGLSEADQDRIIACVLQTITEQVQ